MNYFISEIVYNMLVKKGYKIIITRKKDEFVSLPERADIVNHFKADIFVSIHNNSSGNPDSSGSEVLYYPKSKKGFMLASKIQQQLIKKLGRPDRGTKGRDDLYVLKHTEMPAVIVEPVFLSNPVEEHLLNDNNFRFLIAEAIVEGIDKYFTGGG